MPVTIDTAGLHPTTEACLEALEWLHERQHFSNVLDMGCGNGILSLASAGIWGANILAADIAPQAVADTQAQCKTHQMESLITVIRSDGFHHEMIAKAAPFDLIIFNLLAEPIVQMAPQLRTHLATGGVCILSGIQEWLSASVEETYRALGFAQLHSITRSPWRTYIMKHE